MSIVRVGLGETKNFADGYEAIFGKKEKPAETPAAESKPAAEEPKAEAKPKKGKKK